MRDYEQSKFIFTQSLLKKAVNCSKHTSWMNPLYRAKQVHNAPQWLGSLASYMKKESAKLQWSEFRRFVWIEILKVFKIEEQSKHNV